MKILVVVAHPNELKIIKQKIKELNLIGFDISFIQTGVGNYETIYNLTKKFENETFDFLLNIGICGYVKENNGLIQVARVKNISSSKELIVPICFQFTQLLSIGSSEVPIKNLPKTFDFDYVDMESYGIEFIANKYQIPRIILKLPSDKVGEKLYLEVIKNSCLELGNIDYITLFTQIKQFLDINLKSANYYYIKEKYKFTYAEFEILKFKIKKYEALSGLFFRDFFDKNCYLDKKTFIKLLEENMINL